MSGYDKQPSSKDNYFFAQRKIKLEGKENDNIKE
jgi:hypothetical protein